MLTRLTRTRRLRAGWLLALAYLFCVVAPAASFALADGPRQMPCLVEDGISMMNGHDAQVSAPHVHMDGAMHDHAAMVHKTAEHDEAAAVVADDANHRTTNKTSTMPCCGMSCPGALPVTLPDVRKPLVPTTICLSLTERSVTDNAPPRLYRPPIS
jgi:hypothetical protein